MKAWAERFYNSKAWRYCRKTFLQTKDYNCERCGTIDDPIFADVAHHRIYLTRENINDPGISLSWNNLEALCQKCHNEEHHSRRDTPRYAFDRNGVLVLPPIPHPARGGANTERGH